MASPVDLAAVRRRVGATVFSRVAGPDGPEHRARIHETEGPRWFGPDRPIREVHGDASMFVGGLTALLLQSLHPLAMAGVAGHSDYKGDPWGRLQRTSYFLAVTTYGPAVDAERTVARIRGIHRRVKGTAPDGRAVRRVRPAPAGVGARHRGVELPARAHPLRRTHPRPAAARRLRRGHRARRPQARGPRPAHVPRPPSTPGSRATAPNSPARPRPPRPPASCCCARRCRLPCARRTGCSPRRRCRCCPAGRAARSGCRACRSPRPRWSDRPASCSCAPSAGRRPRPRPRSDLDASA